MREHYLKNREKYLQRAKEQYNRDPEAKRRSIQKLKREILLHYSKGKMECAICGYKADERALTLDHIGGGGRRHRAKYGNSPQGVYRELRKNRYPPGYRILCMNCNLIESLKKIEEEVNGRISKKV